MYQATGVGDGGSERGWCPEFTMYKGLFASRPLRHEPVCVGVSRRVQRGFKMAKEKLTLASHGKR